MFAGCVKHAIVGWVGGGWVVGVLGGLVDPFIRCLIFSCSRGLLYFAPFFSSDNPAGNWNNSGVPFVTIHTPGNAVSVMPSRFPEPAIRHE